VEISQYLLIGGLGFGVSLLVTLVVLKTKVRWALDQPDGVRKTHETPIPRIGGLPIMTALLLGLPLLILKNPQFMGGWWPVLLCCSLMFFLGFIDDVIPLGAKIKFLGQIGIALIAYGLGLSIDQITNPFGEGSIQLGALSLPITVFWLVAVTNIINLIDGMDGLAGGVGLFICVALGIVGIVGGQTDVAMISLLFAGGLLGFLFFNFPPAKIFLGDGGAYLLGFFIASVSMASSYKGTVAAAIFVVMVTLGIPILDTLFAILRRGFRGLPIFRADAEHLHHRLLQLGYSKTAALFTLYGICGALSLIGLSFLWVRGMSIPIAAAAFTVLGLVAARYLGYIGSVSGIKEQALRAIRRRGSIQQASVYYTLLEYEIDRCIEPEEFHPILEFALNRLQLSSHSKTGQSLEIPIPGGGSWLLSYDAGGRSEEDAETLALTLLPIYVKATRKWDTFPCYSTEPIPLPHAS
jgi:UDP-GlcNAc:undecaprenyl-phosphate/decaprenyl-phosphate GlcNAc-1-phosphate transferase